MLISSGAPPLPSTSFLSELLYSAARERVSEETWERALHDGYWARECVHSPDVCPCRDCVCMCVCRVRSIVLSIWNMPRSSSSRAMSPQNTAAGGGEVHTVSSRVSNTTQHLMPSVVWILWMGSPLLPQNNTTGNNLKSSAPVIQFKLNMDIWKEIKWHEFVILWNTTKWSKSLNLHLDKLHQMSGLPFNIIP